MFSKNKNEKKKLEDSKILSGAGGSSVGSETCRRNKK